jgi:hypothetical protein
MFSSEGEVGMGSKLSKDERMWGMLCHLGALAAISHRPAYATGLWCRSAKEEHEQRCELVGP